MIWRRLSHPNVLPVLGVALTQSPLCIVSEWMVNGNIIDFTSSHPEVNRLRLVRSVLVFPRSLDLQILKCLLACRSSERIAVPSLDGNHPQRSQARACHQLFPPALVDDPAKMNIVIDSCFRPRLTDYGLVAIVSDPNTVDPGSTTSPSVGTVRYMAPELLNPWGFCLDHSNPTKKTDIYAFGVVIYYVGIASHILTTTINAACR